MTRRLGLAAALCLTTIVGFAVIVLGRQAGFFGGGASTEAQPLAELPSATAPVPASPTPIVIEQYIYRDQYYSSGSDGGDPAPASNTNSPTSNGSTAQAPASTPNPPGDDDGPPPASPAPSQATAAPPASTTATEFVGQILALSGDSMIVSTAGGQTTAYLSSSTAVHGGALAVGANVHVHASRQSDGTLLATEIEVSAVGEHEDD
jgi:hypothetical protein